MWGREVPELTVSEVSGGSDEYVPGTNLLLDTVEVELLSCGTFAQETSRPVVSVPQKTSTSKTKPSPARLEMVPVIWVASVAAEPRCLGAIPLKSSSQLLM